MKKWYNHDWLIQKYQTENLSRVKKYVSGRLLDVGCGTKPYRRLFAENVTEHFGVDLRPERSANKELKSADIYCDIAGGLPFQEAEFDSILCTEVIEHVREPGALIKEMARVLKKGRYLVLTAPECWGLHEEPNDYYRYTRYGLEYLVESNGLRVISLQKKGGLYSVLGQRLSSALHYTLVENRSIFQKLFFKTVYILISRISFIIDTLNKFEGDTLGYTLVAVKE